MISTVSYLCMKAMVVHPEFGNKETFFQISCNVSVGSVQMRRYVTGRV